MKQGYKSTLPYLCSLFSTLVIAGNIYALKLTQFAFFSTPAGMICFPFTYTLGDIITEVFGYRTAKRIILISLLNLLIFEFLLKVVILLPSAPNWHHQNEFTTIFNMSTRIFLGTIGGYLSGELVNTKILSMLKYITKGNFFLPRCISSTLVGVSVDTLFFNLIAFYGVISFSKLLAFTLSQYFIKVALELIGSIIAYKIIPYIKAHEKLDIVDTYSYRWLDRYKNIYSNYSLNDNQ